FGLVAVRKVFGQHEITDPALNAPVAGDPTKELSRRRVVRRHRGFEPARIRVLLQKRLQEPTRHALLAHEGRNTHLPDEHGVRALRRAMPEHEAGQLAVDLRDYAGVGKVDTEQYIEVSGVQFKTAHLPDQLVHAPTVFGARLAKHRLALR